MRAPSILAFAISAALVAATGCDPFPGEPTELQQRRAAIVGGRVAAAGEYPAVVALVGRHAIGGAYRLICSGTVVAPDVVLTAAHCLDLDERIPMFVMVGDSVDRLEPARTTAVVRRLQHPSWGDRQALPDDVGLVWLEQPIIDVTPLALLSSDEAAALTVGATATIVGFGGDRLDGDLEPENTGTKKVAFGARVTDVKEREVVISEPGSAQACRGDSGGPALLDLPVGGTRIIGPVSLIIVPDGDCAGGAVYPRIDVTLDFVREAAPEVCIGAICPRGPVLASSGLGLPSPSPSAGCGLVSSPTPNDSAPPIALVLLLYAMRRRRARRRVSH